MDKMSEINHNFESSNEEFNFAKDKIESELSALFEKLEDAKNLGEDESIQITILFD